MGKNMKPVRIQRKRTKGYRMPPNTVSVTRPSKWGNPFYENPVEEYRWWVEGHSFRAMAGEAPSIEEIIAALRGKNLACFCPLDRPCHADVLLEMANPEITP